MRASHAGSPATCRLTAALPKSLMLTKQVKLPSSATRTRCSLSDALPRASSSGNSIVRLA